MIILWASPSLICECMSVRHLHFHDVSMSCIFEAGNSVKKKTTKIAQNSNELWLACLPFKRILLIIIPQINHKKICVWVDIGLNRYIAYEYRSLSVNFKWLSFIVIEMHLQRLFISRLYRFSSIWWSTKGL